jgi:patatin-like phospholipase/acyl hydrolase
MRKILSIDAGGVRGIIPATILAELETRTGQPVCSLFDFLAGTSSGGMLVLGLTCPDAFGCRRPLCSATKVTELFYEWGIAPLLINHRKQVGRSGRLVPETALKTYFATSFAMPC